MNIRELCDKVELLQKILQDTIDKKLQWARYVETMTAKQQDPSNKTANKIVKYLWPNKNYNTLTPKSSH